MKTRRFVIKCVSEEVCYELLNKITEEVSVRWMRTEVDGNKLIIEAIGLPYELKSLRYEIEELKRELESALMPYTKVHVDEFPKLAKVTVPFDALVEALKLLGYSAKVEGGVLESDAPFEEVVELAKRIREAMSHDVVRFRLPHSAKKAVAVLSALYGVDPEEVVRIMEDRGYLELGDFKYELKEDWKKIIKELVKQLGELRGVE